MIRNTASIITLELPKSDDINNNNNIYFCDAVLKFEYHERSLLYSSSQFVSAVN